MQTASDEASRLGDELKPRKFIEFFADKPALNALITLRKFSLPAKMENIYSKAIRRTKKGKASEPDGVPIKLLKICPAAFSEILFELLAAEARMERVMKD